jgi:transposase
MEDTIVLTEEERAELSQRAASRSGRADDARRARLILLLEAGRTWATIRDKLDCNDAFIDRWSKRFREERLAGLFSRHAGQEASTLTPALEARILEWTLKRRPPHGSTQWSTRKLGTQLKISHMMVARVWTKHGLKPDRLDRYYACPYYLRPHRKMSSEGVLGSYHQSSDGVPPLGLGPYSQRTNDNARTGAGACRSEAGLSLTPFCFALPQVRACPPAREGRSPAPG